MPRKREQNRPLGPYGPWIEWVRRRMDELALTQADLAARSTVPESTLSGNLNATTPTRPSPLTVYLVWIAVGGRLRDQFNLAGYQLPVGAQLGNDDDLDVTLREYGKVMMELLDRDPDLAGSFLRQIRLALRGLG